MSLFSSPDWMRPSLMKSSQMLWPRSWSWAHGFFMSRSPVVSGARLRGRQHDPTAFRVDRGHDAMAPRHVRGRTLELHALRREVAVGAIHVLDHEVERRLLRRARLTHPLHGRHESDAGRMAGLDVEIIHLRILLEPAEPQEVRVEALHVGGTAGRIVHVLAQKTDVARRGRRSAGLSPGLRTLRGLLGGGLLRGRPLARRGALLRRGLLGCLLPWGHE